MIKKDKSKILIPIPNKVYKGGICSYWSAIISSFSMFPEVSFEIVKVGNTGKNIFGPFQDQWKFYKASKKEIDLVVLNPSILNKAFFREALFAKQLVSKDIPFIAFFHGWDLEFEKKVSERYTRFFQNSYGQAQKIITLSPEARDKILEWGYKGEVIVETTVVDSTLVKDFSFETRKENSNFKKRIQILFLARMEIEKGIYELIDAFNELRLEFNTLELVLAGNGTAYNEVVQYVSNMEHITILGHIEGEGKAKVFKECDIYCLPSYSEGLPVSVLEAMAFSLPIITTSVGGLKYFFKEEKMGYTAAIKSRIDLKEKLKKLILNHTQMDAMGKFNYDYAQEHLMSDSIASRVHKHLIDEVQEEPLV